MKNQNNEKTNANYLDEFNIPEDDNYSNSVNGQFQDHKLVNLLKKMSKELPLDLNMEDSPSFQELCKYFDDEKNSNPMVYSPITYYVFYINKEPDSFIIALKQAIEIYSIKNPKKSKYGLFKLVDHLQLASLQAKHFNLQPQIDAQQKKLNNLSSDVKKTVKHTKRDLKSIRETKSSIYGDFIAILGIFSALVFTLFGGFTTFADVMTNVSKNQSLSRVIISISLLGIVLICLVFCLLQFITAILNGSENNKGIKGFLIKYLPIIIVLVVFVLILIAGICCRF